MDQNDHLKELAHIRGLMNRSTRFLSLSGLSGVFAGCVALAGAVLARYHINAALGPVRDVLTYGTGGSFTAEDALLITLITDAALVLLVALLGAGWFTWRRSTNCQVAIHHLMVYIMLEIQFSQGKVGQELPLE